MVNVACGDGISDGCCVGVGRMIVLLLVMVIGDSDCRVLVGKMVMPVVKVVSDGD